MSSLFDPLGFLSPFILPVKVLLQELWRMEIQWDERVLEPLLTQWHRWVESLPLVAKIKIPRCFRNPSHATTPSVQLHYFSDASNHGYAAVSYLRLADDQRRVHPTDEGVIPETSRTNKTEHFFMNIFHIEGRVYWSLRVCTC